MQQFIITIGMLVGGLGLFLSNVFFFVMAFSME